MSNAFLDKYTVLMTFKTHEDAKYFWNDSKFPQFCDEG